MIAQNASAIPSVRLLLLVRSPRPSSTQDVRTCRSTAVAWSTQTSSSRAYHNTYGASKPSERAALTDDMPTDEQDGLSEQTGFLSVLRAPSGHENEAANQPRVIPLPSSMTDALADYFSLTTPQREDLHEHFDVRHDAATSFGSSRFRRSNGSMGSLMRDAWTVAQRGRCLTTGQNGSARGIRDVSKWS
ncbi:hypothetical protein JB92DRAFT_3002147 [Gautieria morchelliformis]|nr:hypothetical protein JB92DRAFT_3002147 [Gautieria morchelliformis]